MQYKRYRGESAGLALLRDSSGWAPWAGLASRGAAATCQTGSVGHAGPGCATVSTSGRTEAAGLRIRVGCSWAQTSRRQAAQPPSVLATSRAVRHVAPPRPQRGPCGHQRALAWHLAAARILGAVGAVHLAAGAHAAAHFGVACGDGGGHARALSIERSASIMDHGFRCAVCDSPRLGVA